MAFLTDRWCKCNGTVELQLSIHFVKSKRQAAVQNTAVICHAGNRQVSSRGPPKLTHKEVPGDRIRTRLLLDIACCRGCSATQRTPLAAYTSVDELQSLLEKGLDIIQ